MLPVLRLSPVKRVLSGALAALLLAASLTVLTAVAGQPQAATAASNPTVSCSTPAAIFNTAYNVTTGGVLANNAKDANWQVAGPYGTVSGTPTWATVGTATGWGIQQPPANATFADAIVGNAAPGQWVASPYNNAQWITQKGPSSQQASPGASWYYRYNFVLDSALTPATYSVVLNFFADNSVAEVYVNGVAQSTYNTTLPQGGANANPLTYTGFKTGMGSNVTLSHGWTTGQNSIVVQTYSAPGNEGFDVQAASSTPCVTAGDDTSTVAAGGSVSTNVLANDSSASGQPLNQTVSISTAPSVGTAVAQSNGTVLYTAPANFSGVVTYGYTVCDTTTPTAFCATATATITVTNVVTAHSDAASTPVGIPVATNVVANDTTSNTGKTLTVSSVQQPAHGSVTLGADNKTITYTPAAGYSGSDTYHYTVCDNSTPSVCDTAAVDVTVTNTVHATADTATVAAGSTVATNVVTNDTVGDASKALSVSSVVQPAHGAVTIGSDGKTLSYTPAAGYSGADSYSYTVCDTSNPAVCDTASVSVTVTNVVHATADTLTVAAGSPIALNVVSNDTTANPAKTLTATISNVQGPSHGTATVGSDGKTVTYTPTSGYSGPDSFSYTVCDTSSPAVCDTASVSVKVTNVVTAVADTASTSVAAPVITNVLSNDTTANSAKTLTATVSPSQNPAHGTVSVGSNGAITYTPNAGFSGTDTYHYTVCDNSSPAVCDTAAVTVTVSNTVVANNDTATVASGSSVATDVTANDTKGDPSKTLTVTVGAVQHGTATVGTDHHTVTYTPTAGYSGPDSYTYQVCDDSTPVVCASATVTVNVTNGIVASPSGAATPQNADVALPVTDLVHTNGAAIDSSSVTVVTPPSHGTLVVTSAGLLTYAPTPGYAGTDSYQINVCDLSTPTHQCADVTVPVLVSPNIVTATPDTMKAMPNSVTTLNVMANDTSKTGQPLDPNSVAITSAPTHGTTSVVNGKVVYTPAAGYSGADSFRYTICDTSVPNPVCDFSLVTLAIPVPADVAVSALVTTGTHSAAEAGAGLLLLLVGFILILWRRRSLAKQ